MFKFLQTPSLNYNSEQIDYLITETITLKASNNTTSNWESQVLYNNILFRKYKDDITILFPRNFKTKLEFPVNYKIKGYTYTKNKTINYTDTNHIAWWCLSNEIEFKKEEWEEVETITYKHFSIDEMIKDEILEPLYKEGKLNVGPWVEYINNTLQQLHEDIKQKKEDIKQAELKIKIEKEKEGQRKIQKMVDSWSGLPEGKLPQQFKEAQKISEKFKQATELFEEANKLKDKYNSKYN